MTVIFLLFLFLTASLTAQTVLDQPVPGAQNGWITIHVAAGKNSRDFHVTYEKEGGAFYVYYNGNGWQSPVKIVDSSPFRSGVHMAVDNQNRVHFIWGGGGGDRNGHARYRTILNNALSPVETVANPIGWNQADITVTGSNEILVAANTGSNKEMAVYRRSGSNQWQRTILPKSNSHDVWAPSITETAGGRLFVASRRKDSHPTMWWFKDSGGSWSNSFLISGHNFEPNLIPFGEFFRMGCYRSDRKPHFMGHAGQNVKISDHAGQLRGQAVGLAVTQSNAVYASYSSQNGASGDINNKNVTGSAKSYYAVSRDNGQTWTEFRATQDNTGQGWGNIAANGNWVMMVWPDARGGKGLRYNLIEDAQSGIEGKVRAKYNQALFNVCPNPFYTMTTIQLNPAATQPELKIFNVRGSIVRNFKPENMSGKLVWRPAKNLAAGPYFIQLKSDQGQLTKQVLVVE